MFLRMHELPYRGSVFRNIWFYDVFFRFRYHCTGEDSSKKWG
jgi:hypothetical protein